MNQVKFALQSVPTVPCGPAQIRNVYVLQISSTLAAFVLNVQEANYSTQPSKDVNQSAISDFFMILELINADLNVLLFKPILTIWDIVFARSDIN